LKHLKFYLDALDALAWNAASGKGRAHCINTLTEHVEEGGEWTRPLIRRKRGLNSFCVISSYWSEAC